MSERRFTPIPHDERGRIFQERPVMGIVLYAHLKGLQIASEHEFRIKEEYGDKLIPGRNADEISSRLHFYLGLAVGRRLIPVFVGQGISELAREVSITPTRPWATIDILIDNLRDIPQDADSPGRFGLVPEMVGMLRYGRYELGDDKLPYNYRYPYLGLNHERFFDAVLLFDDRSAPFPGT